MMVLFENHLFLFCGLVGKGPGRRTAEGSTGGSARFTLTARRSHEDGTAVQGKTGALHQHALVKVVVEVAHVQHGGRQVRPADAVWQGDGVVPLPGLEHTAGQPGHCVRSWVLLQTRCTARGKGEQQ